MQSATTMETASLSLPDDLLAGVFCHLPARSLAASRGTCRAWRDLIDERQLLLRFRRLLPHTVRGLFINYHDYKRCHFLSRPTPVSSPEADGDPHRIDGKFDFIKRNPYNWYEVVDHCNGLVLFLDSDDKVLQVCNPATRWSSARLPPCPAGTACIGYNAWERGRRMFLVFDPFASPEYKVLLSPAEPKQEKMKNDACHLMEWPPSAWMTWHEFSSSTGRWQQNVFVREGEAAGTVGDLLLYDNYCNVEPPCRYAAYWKGALYIHWRGEFVSRLSLLDDKYCVIKSPVQLEECKKHGVESFLGKSENGVYIAAIASEGLSILQIWTLGESGSHIEWVPKDQNNLKVNESSWRLQNNKLVDPKYWTLDQPDDGMFNRHSNEGEDQDVFVEKNVCWNSDDDNIINISDIDISDDKQDFRDVMFLGFHPYKEIIFLCSNDNAVAFDLTSPKVQYLGNLYLNTYNQGICKSFVYTPCLIGDY